MQQKWSPLPTTIPSPGRPGPTQLCSSCSPPGPGQLCSFSGCNCHPCLLNSNPHAWSLHSSILAGSASDHLTQKRQELNSSFPPTPILGFLLCEKNHNPQVLKTRYWGVIFKCFLLHSSGPTVLLSGTQFPFPLRCV